MTTHGQTRDVRRRGLELQDKRALVTFIIARDHYRLIDGSRPNYADLRGLSRADLVDLILNAEYPEVSDAC